MGEWTRTTPKAASPLRPDNLGSNLFVTITLAFGDFRKSQRKLEVKQIITNESSKLFTVELKNPKLFEKIENRMIGGRLERTVSL